MKKYFLFLLTFLAFSASVWAQGVSLFSYSVMSLTDSRQQAETWTEFNLGESGDIAGKWLSTTDNPQAIPSDAASLELTAIPLGFEFPWGGRTMTTFGVCGDGIVYLGSQDKLNPVYPLSSGGWNSTVWPDNSSLTTDVIFIMPKLYDGYDRYMVSADLTETSSVAYLTDPDKGELTIRFKDLSYTDGWETFTFDYDVVLHEEGTIDVYICGYSDAEQGLSYSTAQLAVILKGQEASDMLSVSSWDGNKENGSHVSLEINADKVGAGLSMQPPLPCERPQEVTGSWELSELKSTQVTGSLKVEGDCDEILVLMSETAWPGKPEDGITYSVGDQVGESRVVYMGVAEGILSVQGLLPATDYFLTVYAANSLCDGGPLYQQDSVLSFQLHTPLSRPQVQYRLEGEDLIITFPGSVEADVMVGVSDKDFQAEDQCLMLKDEDYREGDTVYYLAETPSQRGFFLQTAFAGKPNNGEVVIPALETGRGHYFYAWIKESGYGYSPEYASWGVWMVGETPQVFSFVSDRTGDKLPLGWTEEDGMENHFRLAYNENTMAKSGYIPFGSAEERRYNLEVPVVGQYSANVISPAFEPSQTKLVLEARVQMAVVTGSATLTDLSATDTLELQIRKVGDDLWNTVASYTDYTFLYDADGFANLKTSAQASAGEQYQVRFLFHGTTGSESKTFSIYSLTVKPELSCLEPENVHVIDSLTSHRAVTLAWTDKNSPAASVEYAYRPYGVSSWSDFVLYEGKDPLDVDGLKPESSYQIALRSACFGGDSSTVTTLEVSTLRGLPYQEDFTDASSLPDGYSGYRSGATFPASGDVELTPMASSFKMVNAGSNGEKAPGSSLLVMFSHYWMVLPTLGMEATEAPASLKMNVKAFRSVSGNYEKLADDHAAYVLVLVSNNSGFSASEIMDTIFLKDLGTEYSEYELDLSGRTRQLHIALALCNPDIDYGTDPTSYFVLDSVRVAYEPGMTPCYEVEDIRQFGLTEQGITLSWSGYSLEYGIILTNQETSVVDTFYTTETEYTFTGLDNNTLYTYQIEPYCEEGRQSAGPLSQEGFFTTEKACVAPINTQIVSVSWNAVSITGELRNDVQVSIWAEDTAYAANNSLNLWPLGMDTVTLSGLEYVSSDSSSSMAVNYYLSLRGICGNQYTAWVDTFSFQTRDMICARPEELEVVAGIDTALLTWVDGGAFSCDHYRVSWASVSSDTVQYEDVDGTCYSVADLMPSTSYRWSVQGFCAGILRTEVVEGPGFTTDKESVSIEMEGRSDLKVLAGQGCEIVVINPSLLEVKAVEVFNTLGQRLLVSGPLSGYKSELHIPSSDGLVVVRVHLSEGVAVYKLIL